MVGMSHKPRALNPDNWEEVDEVDMGEEGNNFLEGEKSTRSTSSPAIQVHPSNCFNNWTMTSDGETSVSVHQQVAKSSPNFLP